MYKVSLTPNNHNHACVISRSFHLSTIILITSSFSFMLLVFRLECVCGMQSGTAEAMAASAVLSAVPSVVATMTVYRHSATRRCTSCSYLDISTPIPFDGLFLLLSFFSHFIPRYNFSAHHPFVSLFFFHYFIIIPRRPLCAIDRRCVSSEILERCN